MVDDIEKQEALERRGQQAVSALQKQQRKNRWFQKNGICACVSFISWIYFIVFIHSWQYIFGVLCVNEITEGQTKYREAEDMLHAVLAPGQGLEYTACRRSRGNSLFLK